MSHFVAVNRESLARSSSRACLAQVAYAIGRRLDILISTGRRRGGGVGSHASSTRTAREETRWGRGRSASPGAASARRRPCRRRRVGDGPAPTRVGRRRRPSEVATANAGRAVRGASWSSRDGAVLSQRETSAAPVGAHDARRACSLSVMGSLRGRSRVSKAVDTMGANFRSPAAASSPIRARTCHLRHAGPTRRTGGHAGATRRRVSSACPAAPLPKSVQESCCAAIGQLEVRRHPLGHPVVVARR